MAKLKVQELELVSRPVIAGETMWLDESRENLVADGDPAAAFLFAAEGAEISRDDALRYGLVKATKDEKAADTAGEPDDTWKRSDLDAHAAELGILEPEAMANKTEVIEAIRAHKAG